jgi:hypothetical protein
VDVAIICILLLFAMTSLLGRLRLRDQSRHERTGVRVRTAGCTVGEREERTGVKAVNGNDASVDARHVRVIAELDAIGELREKNNDAIFEVFDRDCTIEVPEQRVRERPVVPCRHVTKALDEDFEQIGFRQILIVRSKSRDRRGLRRDPLGNRTAIRPEQDTGQEHRLDDGLAGGIPMMKLKTCAMRVMSRVRCRIPRQARQNPGFFPMDLFRQYCVNRAEQRITRTLFRIEQFLSEAIRHLSRSSEPAGAAFLLSVNY